MGGRWRSLSLLYNRIAQPFSSLSSYSSSSSLLKPHFPSIFSINRFLTVAAAIPSHFDSDPSYDGFGYPEDDQYVKIPIKAFFLSTRFHSTPNYYFIQVPSFIFSPLLPCQFRKWVALRNLSLSCCLFFVSSVTVPLL